MLRIIHNSWVLSKHFVGLTGVFVGYVWKDRK